MNIPISVGPSTVDKDNAGAECVVYDVIINPKARILNARPMLPDFPPLLLTAVPCRLILHYLLQSTSKYDIWWGSHVDIFSIVILDGRPMLTHYPRPLSTAVPCSYIMNNEY